MFKIRHRNCLLITFMLVLIPCIVIFMIMGPELSTEQTLSQRLAECHMRLQFLESMYRARQEDVAILTQFVDSQQTNTNINNNVNNTDSIATTTATILLNNNSYYAYNSNNNNIKPTTQPINITTSIITTNDTILVHQKDIHKNIFNALSPEARQMLKNVTTTNARHQQRQLASNANIRLPTAYHFLPHLLDDPSSLRPAYIQSKGRTDVSIVLGIPTVKREKQSYLLGTLQNLIESMNEEEQNDTLIIVFIGELDRDVVLMMAKQIEINFETYIECGLLDIIAPAPGYYPDFKRLRITLNDSLERVKWRSKQNLDFSYLMAYAQTKGTFYVQLEDDILAKKQFISSMKKFAYTKSVQIKPDQPSWFILDFCQLGFIGKMFKSAELPYLITFFQMFYNDKPVDWLLTYFIESKVCRTDKDQKHCNIEKAKYWLHYRPSLFQHIGTSSSLKGKVQKLKDKQFGWKVPSFHAHTHNPPAQVKSNIAPYKNFQLKRAYRGETYFWGLLPQPGDLVQFIFDQPTFLKHYLLRSGNSEHPSDRFYNTTIEVLPADTLSENSSVWTTYNSTADGYLIIGAFDAMGVADGNIDPKIGAIKEFRLHIHGDTENWALLSEIDLQVIGGLGESDVEKKKKPSINS